MLAYAKINLLWTFALHLFYISLYTLYAPNLTLSINEVLSYLIKLFDYQSDYYVT